MIQSSDPGRDMRSSLLQNIADQLWGPPSITFNGYCFFFFCWDQIGRHMTFTTDTHLKARLRMCGSMLLRPSICTFSMDMDRFASMFYILLVW